MLESNIEQTTTQTGAGTLQLLPPTNPQRISFAAGVGNGNQVYYRIEQDTPAAWEEGFGVVTQGNPDTLTRNLIRSSTGTLLNLASGTKRVYGFLTADAARFGGFGYPTATGTANALVVINAPTVKALRPGMVFRFRSSASPNTGPVTLNMDSLGAASITTPGGAALDAGTIPASSMCEVMWNGTNWILTQLPGWSTFGRDVAFAPTQDALLVATGVSAARGQNRIINGCFRVDQRVLAGGVTAGQSLTYGVDRWATIRSTGGAPMTVSRVTDPDLDGAFALSATNGATAVATFPAGDFSIPFRQGIEGTVFADLRWGTARAQPITVSFDMRASVAGIYTVALRNGAATRCHVAEVSHPGGNLWRRFAVTVPGDTLGAWATDVTLACEIMIGAVSGSSNRTAPGVWTNGTFFVSQNAVNWLATANQQLLVARVQLERGSVATPFEQRLMGLEERLCERYFERTSQMGDLGFQAASTVIIRSYPWRTTKRVNPTIAVVFQNSVNTSAPTVNASYTSIWGWATISTMIGTSTSYSTDITVTATAEL